MKICLLVKNHHRFIIRLLTYAGIAILLFNLNLKSIVWHVNNENKSTTLQEYPTLSNDFLASKLRVDRFQRTHVDIVHDAQKAAPTFPLEFWEQNKDKQLFYKNSSCARFPSVYELQVNNLYWQILNTVDGIFYLFGAYYDVRKRCSVCPAVRILAMINRNPVKIKTYCQIWFADSQEPAIVQSLEYFCLLDWKDMATNPYLITCPIPQPFKNKVPLVVSLVEKECDTATNSVRVMYNKPENSGGKKKFAVCVKMMDFIHEDQSPRLVEWLELVQLLGAEKIIFYTLHIHENITKVLKYYEERGTVEIVPTTLAGNRVNVPFFQHLFLNLRAWPKRWVNEFVQLNDCFYRHMYEFDYITVFDTDEVIVPKIENNWSDLMREALKNSSSDKKITSYETSMVIFPHCANMSLPTEDKGIPPYMYILQHILSDRGKSINHTPKTFFDTEMVEAVNNHWGLRCLIGSCKGYGISRDNAELFHYRNAPFNDGQTWSCDELIKNNRCDTSLWKFKEPLINRTLASLHRLQFYS